MEITTRNPIDIERYSNDIRERTLRLLFGEDEGIVVDKHSYAAVAHAFDRATTTALFKHITATREPSINDLAAQADALHGPLKSGKASGKGKGGPKPGSAAAKARAQKAQATRRRNKAANAAGAGEPETFATATVPARTGFGGTPQSGVGG